MKGIHTFAKFVVDLAITVFWVWVPMFHFDLKASKYAPAIWVVDIATLVVLLYWIHSAGRHRLVR